MEFVSVSRAVSAEILAASEAFLVAYIWKIFTMRSPAAMMSAPHSMHFFQGEGLSSRLSASLLAGGAGGTLEITGGCSGGQFPLPVVCSCGVTDSLVFLDGLGV